MTRKKGRKSPRRSTKPASTLWGVSRRSHRIILFGGMIVMVLTVGLLIVKLYSAEPAPAPLNFVLQDVKGRSVELSDFHGQVVHLVQSLPVRNPRLLESL
jgi:hypothetical protein